jgi:tellurite resistance protein
VVRAYDRNARAEYFQQKYPGLSPDEIADILTIVTMRYAAIAGAVAGAAITINQVAVLSSAGMTAALLVTTIGAEMIYLARIQMRLILDLSVVYDLQLNSEDPEDMLMIMGYAIGVAPTDLVGKGFQTAGAALTKGMVKEYISKDTLKLVQEFARHLGFKILQRDILKFAVPVASAAVGSTYNYVTTQAVGRFAKVHFKNRGKVTEELRVMLSRQNTYDLVFPAAALYMAQIDGEFSTQEKELYRAMLSRMSFEPHLRSEFQKLADNENALLETISQIEDNEIKHILFDVIILMAVYDGKLVGTEREFLTKVAAQLGITLDMNEIEQGVNEYKQAVKESPLRRAASIAGKTASNVRAKVTEAGQKVKANLSHEDENKENTGF